MDIEESLLAVLIEITKEVAKRVKELDDVQE